MAWSRFHGRLLAGTGALLALGGAALLPAATSAQQPPAGRQVFVACSTAAGAMSAGTAPPNVQTFEVEGGRGERIDFAGDLARALGKTRDEVERALEEARRELPPPDHVAGGAAPAIVLSQGLEQIATRLGVTVDELTRAMQAAAPCPSPPPPGAQPSAGAVAATPLDPMKLFDAIAAQLGRGITGERVRAAFEAGRPANVEGEVTGIVVGPGPYLEALARALGVTVEQLEAALRQIAPRKR